jgi:hypothetical protein
MSLFDKVKANRGKAAALLLAFTVACGVVAVSSTGAYFSDTHDGTISGTVGNIHVAVSGGSGTDSTNFAFNNMLPGDPQTAALSYYNSGSSPEDVWVVFPNATALSALNNLGTYGEVHVKNNSKAIFDSANLNDRSSTCGDFSPSGCWPLMKQYKLASNVAPGLGGTLKFTFNYAGKLKSQPAAGTSAPFNAYPIPGQTTTNNADGSGSGLPYQLVATQVGQQP